MPISRRNLLRSSGLILAAASLISDTAGCTHAVTPARATDAPDPNNLHDLQDIERAAKAVMSPMAWEYVSGGAADELTLRWNHEAYEHIRLKPRALIDVSHLDTRIRLLGREFPFPILLAPTAYQKISHPQGEIATAKGAGAADATMVVSTMSNVTLEEVAAAATRPLWFQLYVQPDRELTRKLVRRAEAAGYEALVVTVDAPVLGPRYRELRANFALPPGLERANLRGYAVASSGYHPTEETIFSATLDPSLTWKDIDWFKSITKLPILLKGIQNPADADRAVSAGVAGIIVSNHGARDLDTAPPTIDSLPDVAAKVSGKIPVLVDGGIRRGTDVLKALASGATAVLIGRPYVFGLAVAGARGVTQVVNILRREFQIAMALCGRPSIADIDPSLIQR